MNPFEQYKRNSTLPVSNENDNKDNLLKILQKIETGIIMDRYDKVRDTISILFDYVDIENHAQSNDPILTLVELLFYIYNYCDKHDKQKMLKVIRTLMEPLKGN